MLKLNGQKPFFNNPTPVKGDTIRIVRRASHVYTCDIGDELFVVSSRKKDGIVYARCCVKNNKHPSELSSTSYEWEIIGEKHDIRKEIEIINDKLDYIISFINKIIL